MRFDVITLFPEMFDAVTGHGVTGRACRNGLWQLQCWNPRDFTHDVHRTVDDRPYGGGPGMVMLAEPLERAVRGAQRSRMARASEKTEAPETPATPVVLLSPAGQRFDQRMAVQWAQGAGVILVCGRYEGVDQRFIQRCVTHEVSVGDFVLSGGELAAMVMMDSVVRLLPGVLNDAQSARQDSFSAVLDGLLDSPHYTRPENYEGLSVPSQLLSGHHADIARWRREQSLALTQARRPDLLAQARLRGELSQADEAFLLPNPPGNSALP